MDIKAMLSGDYHISDVINELKKKEADVMCWGDLEKDYEPTKHYIVTDLIGRKDKKRKDGSIDKASRIHIGLEKLLVSRMVDFMFALPVKRVYNGIGDNKTRESIMNAIEAIYKHARVDTENIKRGVSYFAACEFFTIWYVVESPNELYGFKSNYKLKCKTYSPMDGVKLFPLFDEKDDMIAMSFEYQKSIDRKTITYFETYTAEKHYKWKSDDGTWSEETQQGGEPISILKIPGVYGMRKEPIYHGLTHLRQEIEYTLSRNSDIIAYNAAPVLKVAGGLQGQEDKGEGQRVFRVENGGDVSYVSWSQSIEATKYQVEKMLSLFFMQSQMPDISFEKMASLGNVGFDARQMMLTDAHLKVGEESGEWIEYLEREFNIVKVFLKEMNKSWSSEIDQVTAEHVITPFVQNDENAKLNMYQKACGGKAVMSQKEAIEMLGISANVDETLAEIQKEEAAAQKGRMESLFGAE